MGIVAFLPSSHLPYTGGSFGKPEEYVGQTVSAKVLDVDAEEGKLVITARKERDKQEKATYKARAAPAPCARSMRPPALAATAAERGGGCALQVGDVLAGVVDKIMPYGAFIRVRGAKLPATPPADGAMGPALRPAPSPTLRAPLSQLPGNSNGLLHIGQITGAYGGRIETVESVLAPGENIKVMVFRVETADGQSRMSLSTRHLEPKMGDMLNNKAAVFARAEEMAQKFLEKLAKAEAAARGLDAAAEPAAAATPAE